MKASLLLLLVVAAAAGGPPAAPVPKRPDPREFPSQDASIADMLRVGATRKLARAALATDPASIETLRLTTQVQLSSDTLDVLDRIVQTAPERIAEAFKELQASPVRFQSDGARDYRSRLQKAVAAAKPKLNDMPREDAARAARQLLPYEPYDASSPDGYAAHLRAFIDAYPGTAAALEAEADAIAAGRPRMRQLDELEAFAAAHPGTVAAARATYSRGFLLAVNTAVAGLEKRGSDPTDRFMKVLSISQDLESGRYPACEWVDRAPGLVAEFFAPDPRYAPDNLDRVIAATYTFAAAHVKPDFPLSADDGIGYVFVGRLASLFKLKGDETGAMDAMFERLEHDIDPAAAKYLRAQYYFMRMQGSPPERDVFLKRLIATLEALKATGSGFYNRKALATLATLRFDEKDFTGARVDLLEYVAAYPDSDWAWVAAARAGLATIEAGQPAQAVTELEAAAARYGANPVACVLTHAYAARAEEAAGRFDRALDHHRQAIRGWDDDYGDSYSLYWWPSRRPDSFEMGPDMAEVVKLSLRDRVSALTQSLERPQGEVVERGRWLLARDRLPEAIETVRPLAAGNGDVAHDARRLLHRAELRQAVQLAAADAGEADEHAALVQLERLNDEPLDFSVIAARIAKACLLDRRGQRAEAETQTGRALADWYASQRLDEPATALERDVAEIRRAVFLPDGGEIYRSTTWNAFEWPAAGTPPFAIVDPTVAVSLAGDERTQVTLRQSFDVRTKVLFLDEEDLALLESVLKIIGGSQTRAPRAVMETPNQPVGSSMDILAVWNQFFAARPGHWGGWELETYPVVTHITFADAARTKAEAAVRIGYSGATVVLEKVQGRWVAQRLIDVWVT